MQIERIIEKAQKLGINTSSANNLERIEEIANRVGMGGINPTSNLDSLESLLDEKIENNGDNGEKNSNNNSLSERNGLQRDSLDENANEPFGKREYEATKGKDGKSDKNYYANKQKDLDKKLHDAKHEKSINNKKDGLDENGHNKYKNKNIVDKYKDTRNVVKARHDVITNKLNDAKSKVYQATHPGEMAKEKVKDAAKDAAKKMAKQAGKAAKQAGKKVGQAIVKVIASNPWILLVLLAIVIIVIIIIVVSGSSSARDGYYDPSCDYTTTQVLLTTCNTETSKSMSLEEYVLGVTSYYLQDRDYNKNLAKALIIAVKTNALTLGSYNSSSKNVNLDDCTHSYMNASDYAYYNKLKKAYEAVEEEIFVSKSYKSTITNLSPSESLTLNSTIVDEMENLEKKNYKTILKEIYNNGVSESDEVLTDVSNRNNIFVGDSRMAGMVSYGYISSDNSVYGTSMGYSWFVGNNNAQTGYNCKNNAISCVNSKIGNTPSNIVIWLGVNDIGYYQSYYNKYYELAKGEWSGHNIYIVSVGYVNDSKSPYVKNSNIDSFNSYMKSSISSSGLSNLKYIDLGFSTDAMSSGTSDGIHYSPSFSKTIYTKLNSLLSTTVSISGVKDIYTLGDYCEYLYITENDYYWWPIGSSSPTAGNVYGGTPTATTITSPYGYRIHPTYGNWRFHSGIDIGAGCGQVVIAAKAGTVSFVSDYDSSTGYGNYVKITHDDGNVTLYAHLLPDSIRVKVGDKVVQGEKIASVGTTGTSTGCHLHFEVQVNGATVNPVDYVSADNPRPVSVNTSISGYDNVSAGEETKKAICESLKSSGYSNNAVAAILLNINHEGGYQTNNLEDCYQTGMCCMSGTYGYCKYGYLIGNYGSDTAYTAGVDSGSYPRYNFVNDHAGYGLIQWTSSNRKAGLYDLAKSQNKSIASVSVQLNYLMNELSTSYSYVYKYITGNYDAYTISYYFCANFEVPAYTQSTCSARASKYNTYLNYVNNNCS